MKQTICIIAFFVLLGNIAYAQPKFTHQDTLRGSITKERAWWDVVHYHLSVTVHSNEKKLSGSNLIRYKVLSNHQVMQLELQEPLKVTRIVQNGAALTFRQEGYSYFITLQKKQTIGATHELTVFYEGRPQESSNPPWSGGITWAKDSADNDWITTTCQGDGASLWWPNKDHAYDEPESMQISITAPQPLMAVANGRLKSIEKGPSHNTYHWVVANPINNYGVNMNIGKYVHYQEMYKGLRGGLECSYYVLEGNLEKAKKQFEEVPRMLAVFEHWFGPYPFYEDGYKLVEVPYAGMEHQSSITYGNGFKNGYKGKDVSGTGWGMKFDFIIVHESGHEWFANSITHQDVADMWIHESFTSYAENLFVEHHFGKEAGAEYVMGTRKNVLNDRPIIGTYNVHHEGSADMYYKGSNMIHTLRQLMGNDEKWRAVLQGLNRTFYHQTVSSLEVEGYLSRQMGMDLSAFFEQYLRSTKIPVLQYRLTPEGTAYRYQNTVNRFEIPLKVDVDGETVWLTPTMRWQEIATQNLRFDPNFYVKYEEVK